MTDLSSWLLEQIAADEAVAQERVDALRSAYDEAVAWARAEGWDGVTSVSTMAEADHIMCHTPTRVLARCKAHRVIVELGPTPCRCGEPDEDDGTLPDHPHYPAPGWMNRREWPVCEECLASEAADGTWRLTLRALASVYADRPGYEAEWRLA